MALLDFDPFVPLGEGQGVVLAFDDSRGLGIVRRHDGPSGTVDYPFHCTAIADGSRTIAVGIAVSWHVAAGRMGRWEAMGIAPVDR